jgi:hypothetical protein
MTGERDRSHDCFEDEVAIDFPSVGHIIERVRQSFLGGAPDGEGVETHTADVSLSTRDAWRGAIVPIELPLRGMCQACGGRGEVWTETCAACCGSGDALVRHPVRLSVPPGIADGARLRFRVRPRDAAPFRVEVRVVIRDPNLRM